MYKTAVCTLVNGVCRDLLIENSKKIKKAICVAVNSSLTG